MVFETLYNSPLNEGTSPNPWKMNLQIIFEKANALESQISVFSMSKERMGLTKNHGKVTSYVTAKEHKKKVTAKEQQLNMEPLAKL